MTDRPETAPICGNCKSWLPSLSRSRNEPGSIGGCHNPESPFYQRGFVSQQQGCGQFVMMGHAGLVAENARMRAALEWYAEQVRLCRLIHSEGDAGRNALADDGGKRAREALNPEVKP